MTDIAVELGSQLPVSMRNKVKDWRYLSMLGNPKTHIKNLGANVAMNITQQTKNKVAGAMEDVVGIFNKDLERTKTLRPANQDSEKVVTENPFNRNSWHALVVPNQNLHSTIIILISLDF